MANWWQRLFQPDAVYGPSHSGLTPAQRLQADLAATLETLDPWDLPAVVAARELVADTTAMMQMVAQTGVERITPTPAILRRPDPSEPYRQTLERIVNDMTRHGRAWLYVDAIGSNGWPLAVHVLDDNRVAAQLDTDGRLSSATVDGQPIPRDRLVWIPMRLTNQHPLGESPLQAIRPALEQLAEVYRYSATYYTTAAVPPYAVVHPTRLQAGQAEDFSDQWALARAERRPAVLSGGITLQTYDQPSAADSLLLDAIAHLDATVARVMQISPSLLNVLSQSSLTYSTTQGEFARWLAVGLQPMFLSRLEAAFTDLLPRGQQAVFDTSNLTRMDFAGRIAAYAQSIAAEIHTSAEARALEGLKAVPDPDPVPIQPNVEGL